VVETEAAPDATVTPFRGLARRPRGTPEQSTPWAVLASALVAGSGQAVLTQDRFVAYLALEGFAWFRYSADYKEGRRQRDAYRRLASVVARAPFTRFPTAGDWDYYERMEHFVESGVLNRNPQGDFEPEVDTSTYNGSIWLHARQTFWKDPTVPPNRGSKEFQL